MLRTVLAAIAGYALIGVLVVFTDQLFSLASQASAPTAAPPDSYFRITLATDAFYSILGGFLCASIARASTRQATLCMIAGGEIIGLTATIALWKSQPHWFAISLLILYPLAVWVGSWFAARRQSSAAASA